MSTNDQDRRKTAAGFKVFEMFRNRFFRGKGVGAADPFIVFLLQDAVFNLRLAFNAQLMVAVVVLDIRVTTKERSLFSPFIVDQAL